MKKIFENNKGFSLLELIITLAILSIIIIPISSFFINSAKATNTANDKMMALSIAQDEMEKIKLKENLKEVIIEKNDDEYNHFSYKVEIIKNEKKEFENKEETKNIIEINSSLLEKNDYYILTITNDNYILKTNLNNPKIAQTVNLIKPIEESINIFIKDNNLKKEKTVKIEALNESIKLLKIYTEKDQKVSILNKLGPIKIYKNYSSKNSKSVLYKVNIKVYKGDINDPKRELIEEIESYKNIVQ
ncbi:prepilin-type N-terminal cleavage/methylation domain-containing protein [Senegalia massiliensis]|uniref:Prepilin-type N-terminal cleavage/methylation domain-containing protein n=1 Tax=Senegalia massiliensis TaxID=1720316 RepID=A0A845QVX1_9CLOT|nr:prepilin-type N-terminal cleavage/methylation domain-containing protein [Senegalia massiliensis]NBI06665.1 prepilin-type N-terminal cleavage/methylation domain-containing protein [Senegalia massiliensis]